MNLSPNLTLDDFTFSLTAQKNRIDNSLPPQLLENAREYALRCYEFVVKVWGGQPRKLNSGYRCPKLNGLVGGSPTSQHMSANAGDYALRPGENIYSLFLKLLESDIPYDQLMRTLAKYLSRKTPP